MIDLAWAREFAEEWVAAWNAHDLERIFSHYTDDFEMTSPLIIQRQLDPSGTLKGKAAIRPYWQWGLEMTPPLRFELVDVLAGVGSIVIYYQSAGRRLVCEVLFFDEARKVVKGVANYGSPAA